MMEGAKSEGTNGLINRVRKYCKYVVNTNIGSKRFEQ